MKFLGLAILPIVVGYGGGLLLDVSAQSDESNIFSLEDKIIQTQSYIETFPFGGGPYLFIENAYLSETDFFDHARIDFTISMEQKPDATFINKVTECIFETDVDVNTECVVCIFRDGLGVNIAKGEQFFESPYVANTPVVLEMNQFLNDDQYITDVENVKSVKIGICEVNQEDI